MNGCFFLSPIHLTLSLSSSRVQCDMRVLELCAIISGQIDTRRRSNKLAFKFLRISNGAQLFFIIFFFFFLHFYTLSKQEFVDNANNSLLLLIFIH